MRGRRAAHADETTGTDGRRRRRDRRGELAERTDRRRDLVDSDGRGGRGDRPRRRSWLRRLVNGVLTTAFVFAALCAAYVLLSDRPITLAVGVVLAVTALVAVVLMDGRPYEEEILDEDDEVDEVDDHDADHATASADDHDDAAAPRTGARAVHDAREPANAHEADRPGARTPVDPEAMVEPTTVDPAPPPVAQPEPVFGAAAAPAVAPAAVAPAVVAPATADGPPRPPATAATPTGAAPSPTDAPAPAPAAPGPAPAPAAPALPTAAAPGSPTPSGAPAAPPAIPVPALRLDEVVEVATATPVGVWVVVERDGAAPPARSEAELLAVLDAVLPDPARPAGAVGVTVAADALSAGVTPALVARCTAAGLRPADLVLEVVLDGAGGGQAAVALGALDAAGVRLAWESRDLDLAALAAVAHLPWSWIVVGTDGLSALGPIGAHATRIAAGIAHDLGFDAVVRTGPAAEPTVDASGSPFRLTIRRTR